MKTLSLLIFTLFCTIGAEAQPWIVPGTGNIYYNGGNVGIGTTSPKNMITARGSGSTASISLESTEFSHGFSDAVYCRANSYFSISPWGSSFGGGVLTGITSATNQGALSFWGVSNAQTGTALTMAPIVFTGQQRGTTSTIAVDATNPIVDFYNGTTGWGVPTVLLMRILGNGNVGIGTTSPEAKLTVKGKIVASEIQVKDVGNIPDYVFKPDYELMSLSKVEDFVKLNQHLPEVPSEKEFKENGMNMAEMNVLLLKKIEELTLYAIEQNKVIEEIKQTLKNQNKKIKK